MRQALETFDHLTSNGLVEACGYCTTAKPAFLIDPTGGAYRLRVACSNEACKLAAPVSLCEADRIDQATMDAVSSWNRVCKTLAHNITLEPNTEGEQSNE